MIKGKTYRLWAVVGPAATRRTSTNSHYVARLGKSVWEWYGTAGGREKLQITSGPVLRGFYTGWGGTRSVTEKSIDSCGRKKKEKNFTGQNV